MDNSDANENVLPKIKIPKEFYVILFLILFLIICLCLIYFKVNIFQKSTNSDEEINNNIFIVFFFSLIIFGLCYLLLPNIKDLKKLFDQINNVTYFILYTIGVILYFGLMPSDIINEYAYIIVPVIAVLGIGIFYLSFSKNYVENFNINYERIKMILLFFSVITVFIVLYCVDPGEFISKNFGYVLLLAI
jgi:ABC-type Mn2+/Zn2+ transport system permease subunit